MKENAGSNGPVARPTASDLERRQLVNHRLLDRRDFGIALASLGAAAMLGLPRVAGASTSPEDAPAWAIVLASLGRELPAADPLRPGAPVFTASGWLLSDDEAAACRQLHTLVG